jgi:hypothetical protein
MVNERKRIAVLSMVALFCVGLATGLAFVSCDNPTGSPDRHDSDDWSDSGDPDTTEPSVTITSPAGGADVGPSFTVEGTASDDTSVASVRISVDGGAHRTAFGTTSWSYTVPPFETTGSHSISVTAEDQAGNVSDAATVTVTVVPGWYAMGHVTDTRVSDLSISSDNERLVIFYRYPNTSLNLDEGIIKEWNGSRWSTMYHASNQCHEPDIAVDGYLISATWRTDGYDAVIGTNANGPFVTMGTGGLGNEYGMTAAVAKGRAYVTYVCRESDDMPSSYLMLHVKSPIGVTGTQKELNGGWEVVYTDVQNDPAITGNSSYWYTAFVQAGFMYIYRDGNDYGTGFRYNTTPQDPELALYDGDLAIAWLEDGQTTVYVARSDGNGLPTGVGYTETSTGFFGSVRIAAHGDDLYLAYVHATTIPTLYVDRYDGAGWSNVLTRSLPGAAGTLPAADIAVYEGNPVVAYVEGGVAHVIGHLP